MLSLYAIPCLITNTYLEVVCFAFFCFFFNKRLIREEFDRRKASSTTGSVTDFLTLFLSYFELGLVLDNLGCVSMLITRSWFADSVAFRTSLRICLSLGLDIRF